MSLPLKQQCLAILAGILYLLALPPVGWGLLVFISFVPALSVLQRVGFLGSVWLGVLFGIVAYISLPISLISQGWWIALSGILTASLVFSVLFALTWLLAHFTFFDRIWLAFPIAYAIVQSLSEPLLSIPISLSVTLPLDALNGNGLIAIVGGYGLDYLVCVVNGLLVACINSADKKITWLTVPVPLVICVLSVMLIKLQANSSDQTPLSIATVDTAVDYQQAALSSYDLSIRKAIESKLDDLTKEIVLQGNADVIVWPENSNGTPNRQSYHRRLFFSKLSEEADFNMIIGSNQYRSGGRRYSVSDHIINGRFSEQSEKRHPVPIVEDDVEKGENQLFTVAGHDIAVGICFDVAFSKTMKDAVSKGAEGLVIVSNDSLFGLSALTDMHIRYVQLRALENGRDIVFLSNTGPSLLVGASGDIRSGYMYADVARVFYHQLRPMTHITWYSRYGTWLSTALLVVLMTYMFMLRRWIWKG